MLSEEAWPNLGFRGLLDRQDELDSLKPRLMWLAKAPKHGSQPLKAPKFFLPLSVKHAVMCIYPKADELFLLLLSMNVSYV